MRAVKDMPQEKFSDASTVEQLHHQETLEFISTVELPSKYNKMLNIAVEEEHERRENDETIIDRYLQIYRVCNLPGPELELKVRNAGYATLYNYNSLSSQDRVFGTSFTRITRFVKLS